MRLINVDTFELKNCDSDVPPYAILSHTWGENEVSYQDLQNIEVAQNKDGFAKIAYTCLQAKEHGLGYAWVDTCCIDKSSSHELSEAINSMYRWYMNAAVCYVYLSDVPTNCPYLGDDHFLHPRDMDRAEAFDESRWFTRGWTLQELIAPRKVLFFGCDWDLIGALANMVQRVSGITGIQSDILEHDRPLSDLSMARRLSWAAKRETTRIEDQAYALFGILDVNMPLLYGEGSKAFLRLQEVIIQQSTDQSIFAWDAPAGFFNSRELLLAPSPRCFVNGSKIRQRRGTASESAFRMSNKGLEINLPIVERRLDDDPSSPLVILGVLDCKYEGSSDILALVLSQHLFSLSGGTPALELYVSGYERPVGRTSQYARLHPVSPADLVGAHHTDLTITKDLRGQKYVQAFNTNEASWFPVRFMGNNKNPLPTLKDAHPDYCWNVDSKTMRLRAPRETCGAIVVEIKDGRSVLIIFGVDPASSQPLAKTRSIYKLAFVDRECPIEPHMETLMRGGPGKAGRTGGLRINRDERVVARLWRGALAVSIENASDEQVLTSSTMSVSTLSPPSSPPTRVRTPSLLSPPPSPQVSRRTRSFSGLERRDSLLSETRSERSDSFYEEGQQAVHRTSQCEHCRQVRANERAKQDEERRKAEAREADRVKAEKQRKLKSRAQQAGVGVSIGSMLWEFTDLVV